MPQPISTSTVLWTVIVGNIIAVLIIPVYLNEHLNRFGSYELDLTKPPAPLPFKLSPPRQSSRHAVTAAAV